MPSKPNQKTNPSPNSGPQDFQLLTVSEAAGKLRVSRYMIGVLVKSRELKSIKIGTRRLIALSDLNDYVNRRRDSGPWD